MKTRYLILGVALLLFGVSLIQNQASAQDNGYRFGVGYGYSALAGGYGRGIRIHDGKRPPYFALYPPVYYSDIVPRPYGVSPFAAPPGITPIEMTIAPEPLKVSNPFFKQDVLEPSATRSRSGKAPAGQLLPRAKIEGSKSVTSTMINNQYYRSAAVALQNSSPAIENTQHQHAGLQIAR